MNKDTAYVDSSSTSKAGILAYSCGLFYGLFLELVLFLVLLGFENYDES